MGEQPLYDLAPLLEIMGVGAVIALARCCGYGGATAARARRATCRRWVC